MTKTFNVLNVLLIIFAITGITLFILSTRGAFSSPSKSNKITPYIDPQLFKTGYLTNTPQRLADVCNNTMYPVQPLYVNYTDTTSSHNNDHYGECAVNIFNSPP